MNHQLDLVIFHYHLLPGGVTDVIRLSLQAFAENPVIRKITIACGREENLTALEKILKELKRETEIRVFPWLDYLKKDEPGADSEKTAELLLKQFGSDESVWLVHNYHLGKNWALTQALLAIGESKKQKILFQIHDFPECGRYENLKRLKEHIPGSLYSSSSSVRYCVINKRDYDLLIHAGLKEEQVHLLENPLPESETEPEPPREERTILMETLSRYSPEHGVFYPDGEIWLYPVRTIRRKNILEGGLIANLSDRPVNLIVTLPGVSEQEKSYSETVERAYSEGLIPGFWGTGLLPEDSGITYKGMIRHADSIFSSSVQEGFGYMYLNAILWKKPLIARYLDIMGGFLPLFESYPALFYREVKVPGRKQLKKRVREEYIKQFDTLLSGPSAALKEKLTKELDKSLEDEGIDFSYLSVLDQYSTLQAVKEDKGYRKELQELNSPLIEKVSHLNGSPGESHREAVFRGYGFDAYNRAFLAILESFQNAKDTGDFSFSREPGDQLLRGFTKMEYLRLLYT